MPVNLLKGAAGSGKSVRTLERIAKSENGPFEIYVPTHKLAEECEARLCDFNPIKKVVVIHGRDYCSGVNNPLCIKHKLANELSKSGHPVFPILCSQSGGKNKPPINCEYYDDCPYIQQFNTSADVYIYTHAYLSLRRSKLETRVPYGVVIDESFFMSLIETVMLPITLLTHPDIPQDASQLCGKIAEAITHNVGEVRGIIDKAFESGSYRSTRKVLRRITSGIKPDTPEQQFKIQVKKIITFKPILTLLEHLMCAKYGEQLPQSVVVNHATGKITIHHRKSISRFTSQSHFATPTPEPLMLLLDASAAHTIVRKFFPECKIQEIPYKRNAHVTQCISTRCSTTSLVHSKNGDKKSKAAARHKIRGVQTLINRLVSEGQRVLVVGPVAVVGNKKTGAKPLLKCPDGCELAHFNAVRGIDSWKGFDTVVIVGRNQPPVDAVENITRAIFFDDHTPLQLTGEWAEEVRGYQYKDGEFGVNVQVHPEPRAQAVLEQIREHESLQAVDRIRLVHNNETKKVILLSNLPLDIEVDELCSWDEIINGGSRLERAWAAQTVGVLPLNAAWLAANHPDLWPTAAAAKCDVRRECRRGQTPNIYTIRSLTPFEYAYKTARQRTWSRCLSRFSSDAATQETLQKLLGEPVAVRTAPTMGEVKKAA